VSIIKFLKTLFLLKLSQPFLLGALHSSSYVVCLLYHLVLYCVSSVICKLLYYCILLILYFFVLYYNVSFVLTVFMMWFSSPCNCSVRVDVVKVWCIVCCIYSILRWRGSAERDVLLFCVSLL
jgi:hypothetical protein